MSKKNKKGQSKVMSLVESWTNFIAGYLIAICIWLFLVPMFTGYEATITEAVAINIPFVIASMVRSYMLRRVFEFFTTR